LRDVERNSVGQQFRFPVAISADLVQISILHTVYRIGSSEELEQQRIDLSTSVFKPGPLGHRRRWDDSEQSKFYRLEFSVCGNYLAVAKRYLPEENPFYDDIDADNHPEGFWSITIWEKVTLKIHSQRSLLWQVITGISTFGNFLVGGSFAFNPRYTLFALTEVGKEDNPPSHQRTVIFDFGKETGRKL
jgi:hypothetical protein